MRAGNIKQARKNDINAICCDKMLKHRPGRAFFITCHGKGGGVDATPGVSKLSVVALRDKDQSTVLNE